MLFFHLTRCLLQEPGSLPALSLYTTGKEVLVRGSETVISVLGMTSIVSSLSHWFGVVFQVQLFLLFRKSCSASSDHPQDRGRRGEVCSFSFGRALLCPCSSNRADRDGGGEEISAGPQRLKPNFSSKIIRSDLQEPVPVVDSSPPLHPLDGAARPDVPLSQQEQQQGVTRQGMLR